MRVPNGDHQSDDPAPLPSCPLRHQGSQAYSVGQQAEGKNQE
jgi:hypothetical protein